MIEVCFRLFLTAEGFVSFIVGVALHRLDYLNITCSWGDARIRRTGLGSRDSCVQMLARTKWVLITACCGNSSVSNLDKATELQAQVLLSKLNETYHCLLPSCVEDWGGVTLGIGSPASSFL